jgi:hypothetical protein
VPDAKLDEDLIEGLSKAKKSPRNFALIIKGAAPVKLLVKKKKIKDADLQKAKTEAKGTDYIVGVIEGSGSEFVFKVLGEKEPSVLTTKIKEMIGEQADMTVKARWELVKELPQLPDDEKEGPTGESKESTTSSDALVDLVERKKQLTDQLKALAPSMQKAIAAQPQQRDAILTAAGTVKSGLAGETTSASLDAAQASLTALQELLEAVDKASATQSGSGTGKISVMKLGKARIEWVSVRDKAVADMKQLRAAIAAEFASDGDQAQALNAALKELDRVMNNLVVNLPEELDKILNAEETARVGLIRTARETLESLNVLFATDPIVSELDGNEVLPDFLLVAPVRSKLGEISAALGS